MGGEGVPYLIDRYAVKSADASWEMRAHELPLDGTVVDFGEAGAASQSFEQQWDKDHGPQAQGTSIPLIDNHSVGIDQH